MTRYDTDLRTQPDALRGIAERFATSPSPFAVWAGAWRAGGEKQIVLTGMGASLFAAQSAQVTMAQAGLPARAIATSDLLDYEHGALDQGLVVVVSQSGESTEVKELLERVEPGRLFSLTNRDDSTLAAAAGHSVSLGVPPDRSVAVRTYTATLAALSLLAAELTASPAETVAAAIRDVADEIERGIPRWDRQAAELADRVATARLVSFVGWGAGVGSALEAALLMKEAARTPSEGMGAAQFRHGAVEVVDADHVLVVFSNSVTERERSDRGAYLAEFTALPGTVIAVGADVEPAGGDRLVRLATVDRGSAVGAIADIVPIQLLAGHVAACRGFESGEFRNTTPVISERPGARGALDSPATR